MYFVSVVKFCHCSSTNFMAFFTNFLGCVMLLRRTSKSDCLTGSGSHCCEHFFCREKGLAPQIVCIERLEKGDDGETWIYGCWFVRPNETFHLATRKFLQKVNSQ